MKYKTFRLLVVAGLLVTGAGTIALIATRCGGDDEKEAAKAKPRPEEPRTSRPEPVAARPVAPVVRDQRGEGLRDMDTALLALAKKPLAGGKGKDVFSGKPYKINIYQDADNVRPNRAKIDLDRDDKWDEKWDFEGPASDLKVKRHVAPADDEQYTVEYRLVAGSWVKK